MADESERWLRQQSLEQKQPSGSARERWRQREKNGSFESGRQASLERRGSDKSKTGMQTGRGGREGAGPKGHSDKPNTSPQHVSHIPQPRHVQVAPANGSKIPSPTSRVVLPSRPGKPQSRDQTTSGVASPPSHMQVSTTSIQLQRQGSSDRDHGATALSSGRQDDRGNDHLSGGLESWDHLDPEELAAARASTQKQPTPHEAQTKAGDAVVRALKKTRDDVMKERDEAVRLCEEAQREKEHLRERLEGARAQAQQVLEREKATFESEIEKLKQGQQAIVEAEKEAVRHKYRAKYQEKLAHQQQEESSQLKQLYKQAMEEREKEYQQRFLEYANTIKELSQKSTELCNYQQEATRQEFELRAELDQTKEAAARDVEHLQAQYQAELRKRDSQLRSDLQQEGQEEGGGQSLKWENQHLHQVVEQQKGVISHLKARLGETEGADSLDSDHQYSSHRVHEEQKPEEVEEPGAKMVLEDSGSIKMWEVQRMLSKSSQSSDASEEPRRYSRSRSCDERKIQELQDLMDVKQQEVKILEAKLQEKEERIQTLNGVIKENEKTAKRGLRGHDVDVYVERVTTLTEQLSKHESVDMEQKKELTKLRKMVANAEQMEGQLNGALKEMEALEEQNQALRGRVGELQHQGLHIAAGKPAIPPEDTQKLQTLMETNRKMRQELDGMKAHRMQQHTEIQQLRETSQAKDRAISQLESEKVALVQSSASVSAAGKQAISSEETQKLQTLMDANRQVRQERDGARALQIEQRREIQQLRENSQAKDRTISQLESEKAALVQSSASVSAAGKQAISSEETQKLQTLMDANHQVRQEQDGARALQIEQRREIQQLRETSQAKDRTISQLESEKAALVHSSASDSAAGAEIDRMKRQLQIKEKEIARLKSTISVLSSTPDEPSEEPQHAVELAQLKKQLKEKDDAIRQLQRDMSTVAGRAGVVQQAEEIEKLNVQVKQRDQEILHLRAQVKQRNQEIVHLRTERSHLQASGTSGQPTARGTSVEVVELQLSLREKEEELARTTAKVEHYQKTANDLTKMVHHAKGQSRKVKELREQLDTVEGEKSQLLSQKDELAVMKQSVEFEINSLQKAKAGLEVALRASENGKERLERLKAQCDSQLKTLQVDNSKLQQQLREKQLKAQQSEQANRKLQEDKNITEQRGIQLHARIENLAQEAAAFRRKAEELQSTVTEQGRELQRMQVENASLRDEVMIEKVKSQTFEEDFKQERQDREQAHNRMAETEQRYTHQLNSMGTELQKTQQELTRHKEVLRDTETLLHGQSQQLQQHLNTKEHEVARLQEEVLSKTQQVKQYKKQADQYREELEAHKQHVLIQKETVEVFGNDRDSLRKRVQSLEVELRKESGRREAFERKSAEQESQMDRLQQETTFLRHENEQLKRKLGISVDQPRAMVPTSTAQPALAVHPPPQHQPMASQAVLRASTKPPGTQSAVEFQQSRPLAQTYPPLPDHHHHPPPLKFSQKPQQFKGYSVDDPRILAPPQPALRTNPSLDDPRFLQPRGGPQYHHHTYDHPEFHTSSDGTNRFAFSGTVSTQGSGHPAPFRGQTIPSTHVTPPATRTTPMPSHTAAPNVQPGPYRGHVNTYLPPSHFSQGTVPGIQVHHTPVIQLQPNIQVTAAGASLSSSANNQQRRGSTPPSGYGHQGKGKIHHYVNLPYPTEFASLPSLLPSGVQGGHQFQSRDDSNIPSGHDTVEKDSPPSSNVAQEAQQLSSAATRRNRSHHIGMAGDSYSRVRQGDIQTNAGPHQSRLGPPAKPGSREGRSRQDPYQPLTFGSRTGSSAPRQTPGTQQPHSHRQSEQVKSPIQETQATEFSQPKHKQPSPAVYSMTSSTRKPSSQPPTTVSQTRQGGSQQPATSTASKDTNKLLTGIDSDIQRAASNVRTDDGSQSLGEEDIPFDPNLVCPHCHRQFRLGQIQMFKKHVAECRR